MLRKLFVTIALAAGFAAVGCQPDTPAEEAAENVEEAGEELGNQVEDACEDVKEEAGADDTDC